MPHRTTDLVDLTDAAPTSPEPIPDGVASQLLLPFLNRAAQLHAAGYATAEDIDTALLLGCGLPHGPLAWLDRFDREEVRSWVSARTDLDTSCLDTPRQMDQRTDSVPPPNGSAVPVPERVVVIGSGTMAAGTAEALARAGRTTTLIGRSEATTAAAATRVRASLQRSVARGRLSVEAAEAGSNALTCTTSWDAVRNADLVIESVAEDPAVKSAVFQRLDRIAPERAILATTTSSLSVTELANATGRPRHVLGLHFFNPAPIMELVELVRTAETADSAVDSAVQLCQALGKRPVLCGDRPGFIVNTLLFPYLEDAVLLAEQGMRPEAIDEQMTAIGFPMGPFRLLDTIGLDVSLQILRILAAGSDWHRSEPPHSLVELVGAGHLGRKSGQGFVTRTAARHSAV